MKRLLISILLMFTIVSAHSQNKYAILINDVTNKRQSQDFRDAIFKYFNDGSTGMIGVHGVVFKPDRCNYYVLPGTDALSYNSNESQWLSQDAEGVLYHFKFVIEDNSLSNFSSAKKITLAWRNGNGTNPFKIVSINYSYLWQVPTLMANARMQIKHVVEKTSPKAPLEVKTHEHLTTCEVHWECYLYLIQKAPLSENYFVTTHGQTNTAVIKLEEITPGPNKFKFKCMIAGRNRGESQTINCAGSDDYETLINNYCKSLTTTQP